MATKNTKRARAEEPAEGRHDAKALAYFETRLLEERRLVVRELGTLGQSLGTTQDEAGGEISSYRFHMADIGSETMEREQTFLLASQEGRLLAQIDEALRRLYRSPATFGQCAQCSQLIDYDRLDALPHATMCIKCKQQSESRKRVIPAPVAGTDAGASGEAY